MPNEIRDAVIQFKRKNTNNDWANINPMYLHYNDYPQSTSKVIEFTKTEADAYVKAYEFAYPQHEFKIIKHSYKEYK